MPDPVPDDLVLAAEFPAASREDWRALVAKIMAKSGAPFPADAPEQALASRTADGIEISPLYDPLPPPGLPGIAPFVRGRTPQGNRAGWDVRARQGHPDPKIANEQIVEDLAGGATSIWLAVGSAGVPAADLPAVLDEVLLDLVAVDLDAGAQAGPVAEAFLALAAERGVAPEDITACLGLNPIGEFARTGSDKGLNRGLFELAAIATTADRGYPGVRAACADALVFHEAGATDAQELGASLALGVAYARFIADRGLTPDRALGQVQFRYAATADQFATIAKLRAARRCWARVAELAAVTGPSAGQLQHAVTSWPMTTRQDPWTNLLRSTVACFGACVGGADAVTVLPFDAALGLPDPLARRIARNTPTLLVEEAHIAAVVDPAGGSGFVETLTEELARVAWALFTDIETRGGIAAVLRSGWLAEQIGAAREARLTAISAGEETVLGVNAFPLADETLLARQPAPSSPSGGLPRIRWAELLEATGV